MTDSKGTQDHEKFINSVKASLNMAKSKTADIRKTDSQLFLANVISPAAATLIASMAAAIGGNNVFSQAAAQAEDGIRDLVRSRGLGDVYKRQVVIDIRF